jgi:outer membrane protein TolC
MAFDVSRARTAASESEAAIPYILATRDAALFELAALMGRVPADYPKELLECVHPPELKQPMPIGDGWQLIQRRPDIRQAQLYPQVNIGGSVGFAGPFSGLSGSEFGGTIGPLLSWTIPNRTAVEARIAQAGFATDPALAGFDGIVLQALKQTESSLSAYSREVERQRSLIDARDEAEHASDQANRLFQFGRTGFIEELSESALANVESELASSRAQLIDRQIGLFLALGGGWETPPDNSMRPDAKVDSFVDTHQSAVTLSRSAQ